MMTERRSWSPMQSGPACSTLGSALGPPLSPVDGAVVLPGPAQDRFGFGAEIGAGGMGRVRLVRDEWLGRLIAVKEPATEADARRLWREALVTARLEHPGIVPIYDLGLDAEGRPWFAMRVVRGRSLAEILGDAPDPRARQDLLRPLLAACEAVGFAHRQGVVHRDLKPANLMVGAFGEMQVIDWGLAQSADLPDGTLGSAGTLSYMSPEQARGESVDARSDVWSLGAVLYEIVVGVRARSGASDAELAAAARHGDTRAIPDETPADLAAILRHTLAPDPMHRYADAKTLADDLARYLDGRRVQAHSYTSLELLRRLLRAWRVPILVAGASLVVLAGLLVAGIGRIQDERDGAERNLAVSLVRDAQRALEEERLIDAQLLASEAMTRAPSSSRLGAEARGVLAAAGVATPTRSEHLDLPCAPDDVAWGQGGALVMCRDRGALALWDDGVRRWSRAMPATMSRFVEGGEVVVALQGDRLEAFDAVSGAPRWSEERPCKTSFGSRWAEGGDGRTLLVWHEHCVARIGGSGIEVLPPKPCGKAGTTVVAGHPDGRRVVVACNDGSLVELEGASSTSWAAGLGTASRPPMVTALDWVDADRVVVGAADGSIEQIELRPTLVRTPLAMQRGLVRRLAVSKRAGLAVALADASAPLVLDLTRAVSLLRLPDPHMSHADFDDAGRLLALVDGRAGSPSRIERWDLSALLPRRLRFPDGVTTVATSPLRGELGVGDGSRLAIVDASRRTVAAHHWQEGIIKTIGFDALGKVVAHGHGSYDIRVFDPVARDASLISTPSIWRRVVVLADQTIVAANFQHDLYVIKRDERWRHLGRRATLDLRAGSDRRSVVRLAAGGTIECGPSFVESFELYPCGYAPDAIAVALDERRLFALELDGVKVWETSSTTSGAPRSDAVHHRAAGAHLLSLAVSGDLVAAGAKDGSVWIWRHGGPEPLAIVRNHRTRVDSVAFDALGRWLVAGGWDGYVSFIEPHDLEARSEQLQTAFGLALEDVLSPELNPGP